MRNISLKERREEGRSGRGRREDFFGGRLPKGRRGRQKRDGYGKKETKVSFFCFCIFFKYEVGYCPMGNQCNQVAERKRQKCDFLLLQYH